MILSDFATTGDGLVAALQVLATLVTERRPASEVCRRFTPLPQRLQNVRFQGASPLHDPLVIAAVRDAELLLGTSGRRGAAGGAAARLADAVDRGGE